MLWGGYIASAIPVLMLLFSGVMKLVKPAFLVEEFGRLGYGENLALVIGILEIGCTVVYLIPRTSILGAILLTGYLGGGHGDSRAHWGSILLHAGHSRSPGLARALFAR
jgi:hypothetical protein